MNLFTEYIALDIGTHSLKFFSVAAGAAGEGYAVQTLLRQELPPGLIFGGFVNPTIKSIPEFSALLKTAIEKIKNRKEGFIVGLPDRWVKLHLVQTAFRSEELYSHEYVSWRLKKLVCPPGIGEVYTDFQILGKQETPEGLQYRFMIGLVKKSIVEILSALFIDLRLEAHAFDTSTLGVYNLFEEVHPDRAIDRNLILVHIGHETTVIKIFERGLLRYERVIEVGGEAFVRILSEIEDTPYPTACENMKNRRFFPVSREDLVGQIANRHTFERIFGNWLRELHVTFRFYQDKFKAMNLPPIVLSGGSSLFEGLPEFLTDFFETPCQRFNPLAQLPTSNDIDKAALSEGPMFAPGIGLLVR